LAVCLLAGFVFADSVLVTIDRTGRRDWLFEVHWVEGLWIGETGLSKSDQVLLPIGEIGLTRSDKGVKVDSRIVSVGEIGQIRSKASSSSKSIR